MLRNVENESLVALWTFGTTAGPTRPQPFSFSTNAGSGPAEREEAKEAVMRIGKPGGDKYWQTAFKELLAGIYESYFHPRKRDTAMLENVEQVHVVIVSDFVQDEGEGDDPDLWAFSANEIQREVSRFDKYSGVMFHLVSLGNDLSERRSVIPIFSSNLEWYKYNEAPLVEPEPSHHSAYFHTFERTRNPLVFNYESGGQVVFPARIEVNEGERETELEIRLIQDGYSIGDPEFKVRISESKAAQDCPRDSDEQLPRVPSHTVGVGQPVHVEIEDPNDFLCIQPIKLPEPLHSRFRLAVTQLSSFDEGDETRRQGDRVTYVTDLVFSPVLPAALFGWWITVVIVLIVVLLSGWAVWKKSASRTAV